jgi:hypothetical protein
MSGLTTRYSSDENFKNAPLSTLAFLPVDEILGAFNELKLICLKKQAKLPTVKIIMCKLE